MRSRRSPAFLIVAALGVAVASTASPAAHAATSVPAALGVLGGSLAGAPARTTAAELKAAQASVDAALKVRKQRLEVWQKAQKARDIAAADVAKKKKAGVTGSVLESALKAALALDEDAAQSRSQLLAAESDVASKGASLLKLYDALLVERRRNVESLAAQSAARASAVSAFRDLAAQRDAVRAALLPVLAPSVDLAGAGAELDKNVDLDARPDDDVETLLEKADLARDLEERFVRQAQAVRERIQELEDERAVARGVNGMVGRSQLFDEEDRRVVVRPDASSSSSATPAPIAPTGTSHTTAPPAAPGTAGGGAFDGNGAPAPSPTGATGGGETLAVENPPPSPFALTQAPAVVHTEQGFAAPQTDNAIAGLLSSQNVSVESLKVLESKLKAKAAELSGKQKKLKSQAKQ